VAKVVASLVLGEMSKSNVQNDWEEREYIEGLICNVKKVTDFLNKF